MKPPRGPKLLPGRPRKARDPSTPQHRHGSGMPTSLPRVTSDETPSTIPLASHPQARHGGGMDRRPFDDH
eukprot:9490648-Pyramimonas_sp.AAC.1